MATLDAPVFPVGLVVAGKPCLVVGGGRVAWRKIRSLLECRAAVTVVAPEICEPLALLAAEPDGGGAAHHDLDVRLRPYRRHEASRYMLVVTATGNPRIDHMVSEDARGAGVWVNCADDASHCSVLLPAVHRDGAVSIAVSTAGRSPALATWLRTQIADLLGDGLGDMADLVAQARQQVHSTGTSTESMDWTSLFDGPLRDLIRSGHRDEAMDVIAEALGLAPGLHSTSDHSASPEPSPLR